MGQAIEELARFVAATGPDDIPPSVRDHAKRVLFDTLGVILAGSGRPEVQALRRGLAAGAGEGATLYARGFAATDPKSAALVNGIAGRSIELCEGLRFVSGQAAMQVLPAVLAIGEKGRAPGRELLAALVLGCEAAARIGAGFTPRPLAHQNGQVPLLAAAAAGARLSGFDAELTSRTIRIAATLLLTPGYTSAVAGATALNVAGGISGLVGVLAPELALAGFTARADAVEEALGQLVGAGFAADGILDGLGRRWNMIQNYFRLYACCSPIHTALDCLAAALAELRPQPQEIARIEVATYGFAAVMRDPDPVNYFASKYSLPHAAAVLAVRGDAGFAAIDDSALADARIAALRHRVEIAEDPAMTARTPALRPARVKLTLADGRAATHARDSWRGDFDEPFSDAELRGKFRELAGTVLSEAGVEATLRLIDECEDWPDVGVLTHCLRQYDRTQDPAQALPGPGSNAASSPGKVAD